MRAFGETNSKLTKYYIDKLMGDSPELMPLDSSLFNDLIEMIARHVCSTFHVPHREKGADVTSTSKYSMATPADAWRCMSTIVMQLPSERIIQDIDKWAKAIDMIIGEDGCIVPDLDLRNGHRKASARIARGGNLLPHAVTAMAEQVLTWDQLSGAR